MIMRLKAVVLSAAVAAGAVSGLHAPAPLRAQEEKLGLPTDPGATGVLFMLQDGRVVCMCSGMSRDCVPCYVID